jgi:hypothetical protein
MFVLVPPPQQEKLLTQLKSSYDQCTFSQEIKWCLHLGLKHGRILSKLKLSSDAEPTVKTKLRFWDCTGVLPQLWGRRTQRLNSLLGQGKSDVKMGGLWLTALFLCIIPTTVHQESEDTSNYCHSFHTNCNLTYGASSLGLFPAVVGALSFNPELPLILVDARKAFHQ